MLVAIRGHPDECPGDRGRVELLADPVPSCCAEREVYAAVCSKNGQRVFEQRVDDLE